MSSSRVARSLFVKSFWNSEDADESLVIGYDCERTTSAKRTTVDVEMKHAQVTASASLCLRAATSTSAKRTTAGRRCGDENEDTPMSQPVPLSQPASSDFYIGQKDDRRA